MTPLQRIQIRALHLHDVDVLSGDGLPMSMHVAFLASFEGDEGGDWFHLIVATPDAVARWTHEEARWGRALLIADNFSEAFVRAHLERLVRHHTFETWKDAAAYLCRYAAWEFEDYQAS